MGWNYIMAMGIGVVGSTVVHLSQGLMKLGVTRKQQGASPAQYRRPYRAGLVMNLSAPFWVIAANGFAPTVFYTSMYAVGLIPLLIYSHRKLGHTAGPREMVGAAFLALGAATLGFGEWIGEAAPMSALNHYPILLCGIIWLVAAPFVGWLTGKVRVLSPGLVMGLLGGGFLALDSLIKGLAQAEGVASSFRPETTYGISLFALSFIGAIAAFGMTQWAHRRGAKPAETIAGYDAAYVGLPVFLVPAAKGDAGINILCLIGFALVVVGLYLLVKAPAQRAPETASP